MIRECSNSGTRFPLLEKVCFRERAKDIREYVIIIIIRNKNTTNTSNNQKSENREYR